MDSVDEELQAIIQGHVESALKTPSVPPRLETLMELSRSKPEENRTDAVTVLDLGACVMVLHRVTFSKNAKGQAQEEDPCTDVGA